MVYIIIIFFYSLRFGSSRIVTENTWRKFKHLTFPIEGSKFARSWVILKLLQRLRSFLEHRAWHHRRQTKPLIVKIVVARSSQWKDTHLRLEERRNFQTLQRWHWKLAESSCQNKVPSITVAFILETRRNSHENHGSIQRKAIKRIVQRIHPPRPWNPKSKYKRITRKREEKEEEMVGEKARVCYGDVWHGR